MSRQRIRADSDQRYYASTYGRFNTADPKRSSARLRNPGSWNRYAYSGGDPINHNDPRGLDYYSIGCDPSAYENPAMMGLCLAMMQAFDPDTLLDTGGTGGSVTVSDTADPVAPVTSDEGSDDSGTTDGGVTGGVGGGSTSTISASTVSDRLYCAARFGDNHSIAAAFGAQNTFLGQFLGGNTISGLVDIGLNVSGYSAPIGGDLAQVALGGAGQGIPPLSSESGIQTIFTQGAQIGSHSAGWDGAAGIAVDKLVSSGTNIATKVLPAKAIGAIGRIGLDAVNVAAWG
jgi:RHS repeat-associated protein